MARRGTAKAGRRRAEAQAGKDAPARPTRWFVPAVLVASALIVLAVALMGRNGGEGPLAGLAGRDPGPVHVHGLGINPSDGALFIATHTGLWRVGKDEQRATRVTDRRQDTMGFTVVGPDRFLGSGHPDLREAREQNLPPHLGLIESNDGGQSWQPVSLLGEADFHVLRSVDARVYGFDVKGGRLLFSRDRGHTWVERPAPAPLLDLAPDPENPSRLLASGQGGLYQSVDDGRNWQKAPGEIGLLAWPAPRRLYLVTEGGRVEVSPDGGLRWQTVGNVGGAPAAVLAADANLVYVALHDGTIMRSQNGGKTWAVRARP